MATIQSIVGSSNLPLFIAAIVFVVAGVSFLITGAVHSIRLRDAQED